jgi:hypothetical protein
MRGSRMGRCKVDRGVRTVNHCKNVSKRCEQAFATGAGNRGTHLSIIDLACAEQCVQRVVAGNHKAGDVDEEGAGNVEEDEEKVQADETEDRVDLGHRRLLLEVVQGGVFGQLDSARVSTGTCSGHAIHDDAASISADAMIGTAQADVGAW